MGRGVIALLLLALAGPTESTRSLVLTYGGASVADMLSTEWVLHQGGQERNPFVKERTARYALNAVAIYASVKGTQKLQRDGHPKWAAVVKWGFLAVRVFAVAHNVKEASK